MNIFTGLPSQMKLVTTHQSKPSAAPLIHDAKMVNVSTALITWSHIEDQHHNGPLTGYRVRFFSLKLSFAYNNHSENKYIGLLSMFSLSISKFFL